ncbi:MAG: hypothetical protein KDA69_03555 [Planctomycetaceae bacterium]|nr:hypothetical protein [Planctomycetaceae bacterium]MCA9043368.1 hypothetical protein [Planctomycetaceae bacterium]
MWQQTNLEGIELDLFEPQQLCGDGAIIYLHGHGGERLSENQEFTRLFEEAQLPVVAPRGGRSWWLDVPSSEFPHELTPVQFIKTKVVEEIQRRWGIEPPAIALLGVSMGGQGVLNIACRDGKRFPCVAALSPAIDFHDIYGRGFEIEDMFSSREEARQHTVTLNLHPLNWPKHQFFASDPQDHQWHPGAERLASKLSSSGILHTADLTTSWGGHGWLYFNAQAEKAITFLKESLQNVNSAY